MSRTDTTPPQPPLPPPMPTPLTPEEEWERDAARPMLGIGRNKKVRNALIGFGGLLIVGFALLQMGDKSAEPAPVRDEYSVAERKNVGKLPERAASAPERAASASDAASGSTTGSGTSNAKVDDALARQRAQLEMQRMQMQMQQEAEARKMAAARQRSELIGKADHAMGSVMHGEAGEFGAGAGDGAPPRVVAGPGVDLAAAQGQQAGGAQDANTRFQRAVSAGAVTVSKAEQLTDLPNRINKGKSIDAKIVPRVQSDLPNTICAQADSDTYSEQDRNVLLPWMTRICGTYSAELRKGQSRVFFVWQEATTHDGVRVVLNSGGSDQLGTAGLGGYVDRHFAEIFGSAALISIIGAGTATAGVGAQDQYNSAAQYRTAVEQAAAETSRQMLQSTLNIPPTVTVAPGTRVRIFVNRDLIFPETVVKVKKPAPSLYQSVETQEE